MISSDGVASFVVDHSRAVVALLLIASAAVGAGAPMVEQRTSVEAFQPDTAESAALDRIEEQYSGESNRSIAQVLVRDDNVLDRASLLAALEYERAVVDNGTVGPTLVETDPVRGVPNLVATAAIWEAEAADIRQREAALNRTAGLLRESLSRLRANPNASATAAFQRVRAAAPVNLSDDDRRTFERAARSLRQAENESAAQRAYRLGTRGVLSEEYEALRADAADLRDGIDPTLDEQIRQLRSMNDSAVERVVERTLSGDGPRSERALRLMPRDYEPGTAEANATVLLVTHQAETNFAPASAPESLIDAQNAMSAIGEGRSGAAYTVFGDGILAEEIDASMTDSMTIVAPLAFLFVLVVLSIAYRDLLDVVLGLFGVALVLAWTFGVMGWAGIDFAQMFIMVPVLLIGLSIDYGIHVFMRHREERAEGGTDEGGSIRASMTRALGALGVALTLVTITTAVGFLSNLTSPAPPIQEVGVVTTVGIISALLVFGALIPGLKIELDGWLEARGLDRHKRAFGTGGGRLAGALGGGRRAALAVPWAVIGLAVLVSIGGAYGAVNVETSFETTDFLTEDPDGWTTELPEPFAPGEYTAESTIATLDDRFVRQDTEAQVLIEGDVTGSTALERAAAGERAAANESITAAVSGGEPAVTGPVSVMRSVAASNETFNATFAAADTDGDGVPDRDVRQVYDTLFAVAPDRADDVIARSGDEYESLRLTVRLDGDATDEAIVDGMEAVETAVDGDGVEATATGTPIVDKQTQDGLLESVINSLAVTLVVVVVVLTAMYRLTEGSATLGVVTVVPVALVLTWVLGTMYLLEIPINAVTALIASLTIGLGIDHSIHLSERYVRELDDTGSVSAALDRAVTGTGGALLGSAATTAGGFGVLLFALLPPLRMLGTIAAASIGYSFLASVLVLPSLLVLWTRYAAPDGLGAAAGGAGPSGGATAVDGLASNGAAAAEAGTSVPDTEPGIRMPETVAMEPARDGDTSPARRHVERTHVAPGRDVSVRVEIERPAGRVLLRETVDGGAVADVSVQPESAAVGTALRDGTLFAALSFREAADGVEGATVTYRATVPDDVADGTELALDGTVRTPDGEATVAGARTVEVVADLFERAVAADAVTADDLTLAGEAFESGRLSERQVDRLYEAWLAAGADAPAEVQDS